MSTPVSVRTRWYGSCKTNGCCLGIQGVDVRPVGRSCEADEWWLQEHEQRPVKPAIVVCWPCRRWAPSELLGYVGAWGRNARPTRLPLLCHVQGVQSSDGSLERARDRPHVRAGSKVPDVRAGFSWEGGPGRKARAESTQGNHSGRRLL